MIESRIPRECPRWQACSVNNCPLDPRYPDLITCKDYPETKCPMERGVRARVGSLHPELKLGGLTTREVAGDRNWASRPEEEKQKFIALATEKLRQHHKKLREGEKP